MSPVQNCELKHPPVYDQYYQVIEGYDNEDPTNCLSFYDGRCQLDWSDYDCNDAFLQAKYYYDYGYSNDDPDEFMRTQFSVVCKPFETDSTALE